MGLKQSSQSSMVQVQSAKTERLVRASESLRARSNLHLPRKIWHMTMGILIVTVFHFSGMSRLSAVVVLSSLLGLDLFIELTRLRSPEFNEKVATVFKHLMRSSELNKMSGTPYYLASTTLAVAIFPKEIAIMSILFLAMGDPMASLVGIQFGHLGPRLSNGKSVIGSMAGSFVCFLVGLIGFLSMGYNPIVSVFSATLAGLVGGWAENLPVDVDDNLSIPLVSGLFMVALTLVL